MLKTKPKVLDGEKKIRNQMSDLLDETVNETLPSGDLVQESQPYYTHTLPKKGKGASGIHKGNNDRKAGHAEPCCSPGSLGWVGKEKPPPEGEPVPCEKRLAVPA